MKRAPSLLFVLIAGSLTWPRGATSQEQGCATASTASAEAEAPEAAWPVVEECIAELGVEPGENRDRERWSRAYGCRAPIRAIARTGTDADRERLWSLFDELPEASPLAEAIVDGLLDWYVEAALAGLAGGPSAPVSGEPPAFIEEAPAELLEAWRIYQATIRRRQTTSERSSPDDDIPFQSNQPAFHQLVASLLRGRIAAVDAARELDRYVWGGWCGTGSSLLLVPQSKGLLVAYLRLGRADLALAAGGWLSWSPFGASGETPEWDRRLLTAAGVDWERFYLGGVLSGGVSLADSLARHGSERAAEQLAAAARVLDPYAANGEPDALLWPLGALVQSNGPCAGYQASDSREIQRDCEAPSIGNDIQESALELLGQRVGAGSGLRQADAASHLLVRLCRPESREAFRVMLGSPYGEVRARGGIGLRALGEKVADSRAARPVSFRLVVDDKPMMRQQVEWTLVTEEWGKDSGRVESDRNGAFELARDPFVDPRQPVASVQFKAPEPSSPNDLWFVTGIEGPADLDTTTTVSVRTGSLTVVIPPALLAPGKGGGAPTATLRADIPGQSPQFLALRVGNRPSQVSGPATWPRLQRGRYQVLVYRDGMSYASPIEEVGERPATAVVSERPEGEELDQSLPPGW